MYIKYIMSLRKILMIFQICKKNLNLKHQIIILKLNVGIRKMEYYSRDVEKKA